MSRPDKSNWMDKIIIPYFTRLPLLGEGDVCETMAAVIHSARAYITMNFEYGASSPSRVKISCYKCLASLKPTLLQKRLRGPSQSIRYREFILPKSSLKALVCEELANGTNGQPFRHSPSPASFSSLQIVLKKQVQDHQLHQPQNLEEDADFAGLSNKEIKRRRKISSSTALRKIWENRIVSVKSRQKVLQIWTKSIAEAAKEGDHSQDKLDWDSYDRIKLKMLSMFLWNKEREQIIKKLKKAMAKIVAKKKHAQDHQLHQPQNLEKDADFAGLSKKEIERRQKISTPLRKIWENRIVSVKSRQKVLQIWTNSIAEAAKEGDHSQDKLDWDSYDRIKLKMPSMFLWNKEREHIIKKLKKVVAKIVAKKLKAERKRIQARETKKMKAEKLLPQKSDAHLTRVVVSTRPKLKERLTKWHRRKKELEAVISSRTRKGGSQKSPRDIG